MTSRLRSGFLPYRRALAAPAFRRLMLGYSISSLGNGAGSIAVAWLATELVAAPDRPYSVAVSLAAYLLPGSILGVLAARWSHRVDPRSLVAADAALRLAGLVAIAALQRSGHLGLALYAALLAVSSLLLSFGNGGVIALLGVHVASESRFAANSVVEAINQLSLTVIGPGLGGLLVALAGAPVVLLVAGGSFVTLLAAAATLPGAPRGEAPGPRAPRSTGLRGLLTRPSIAWLFTLTLVFYGLYGPCETAFPILVQRDLRGGPALLGAIWLAFGVGALLGGTVAGTRTIRNLRRFAVLVVAGWGLALLVLAATDLTPVILAAIAVGGAIYAPYPAAATTLLQRELAGAELTSGSVAWSGAANGVVPIGMLLGGPLVAGLGPRGTLAVSAIGTIALAAAVTATLGRARSARYAGAGD